MNCGSGNQMSLQTQVLEIQSNRNNLAATLRAHSRNVAINIHGLQDSFPKLNQPRNKSINIRQHHEINFICSLKKDSRHFGIAAQRASMATPSPEAAKFMDDMEERQKQQPRKKAE